MSAVVKWGVVTTAKADANEILRFVAYHLSAGAHRIHVFLDAPTPVAYDALQAHPQCQVTLCDDENWKNRLGRRPIKHQVRQTRNATFGYNHGTGLDWVVHLDIDEFLVSETPIATQLDGLPADCLTARVRPMEALALPGNHGIPDAFKAFVPNGSTRQDIARRLYPTYGRFVRGGFVSHVAGKLFARTGQKKMRVKIHNVSVGEIENPNEHEITDMQLAHCHASHWAEWRSKHAFRHAHGSYRQDLAPAPGQRDEARTLHELFADLTRTQGEAGLAAFFEEVCADTPAHREKLQAEGLLRLCNLDLEAKLSAHFPEFSH